MATPHLAEHTAMTSMEVSQRQRFIDTQEMLCGARWLKRLFPLVTYFPRSDIDSVPMTVHITENEARLAQKRFKKIKNVHITRPNSNDPPRVYYEVTHGTNDGEGRAFVSSHF